MALAIAIANRQRTWRADQRMLKRLAKTVLRREQVTHAEISIALVDDRLMRALNARYLGHDDATDVLSFPYEDHPPAAAPGGGPQCRRAISGEVVVSVQTAARQAARYRTTLADEVALYLVHGLLHLCGYDDQTPQQRARMRRRERELLPRRCAARRYTGPS